MVHHKSDILDLRMVLHGESAQAIKVSEDGDVSKAMWLPLSQIEFDRAVVKDGVVYVDVQIPQWIAENRRLV